MASGWDVEIALDVETVHAICQNCRIVLVEAKDNQFASLAAAVDRAATEAGIISNSYGSYGFDGSNGKAFDKHWNKPNHAMVVSAGDSGWRGLPGRPEHDDLGRRHQADPERERRLRLRARLGPRFDARLGHRLRVHERLGQRRPGGRGQAVPEVGRKLRQDRLRTPAA